MSRKTCLRLLSYAYSESTNNCIDKIRVHNAKYCYDRFLEKTVIIVVGPDTETPGDSHRNKGAVACPE